MVDLDYQNVRDLLSNLLIRFLTVTLFIWILVQFELSLCVVALKSLLIAFGLIGANFFYQDSESDVCGFVPLEPASWILTLFSLISTFRGCVVFSLHFSHMAGV